MANFILFTEMLNKLKLRTLGSPLLLSLCIIGFSLVNLSPKTMSTAFGQENSEVIPLLLEAETIDHDRELGIITARDNVIIRYQGKSLEADTLSYNQNTGMITASGNVRLTEVTGEVITTNYISLDEELKNGVMKAMMLRLDENARVAANGAVRTDDRYTEMAKAVYSPCKACVKEPDRPLLWQVKANRVVHDQEAKEIVYYDARLEMLGVPVLYTPYLSQADPSVRYKSGLLNPSFGSGSKSGLLYAQPVYWNISNHEDMTFTPIYTANSGMFLDAEYRKMGLDSSLKLNGAISEDTEDTDHGSNKAYLRAVGQKDINHNWRANFDVAGVNDRQFIRDYQFLTGIPTNYIQNDITLEGFNGTNYIAVENTWYQELRSGNETDHPIILPQFTYSGQTLADDLGGRWKLDGMFRQLTKSDDVESGQRVNLEGKYSIPFLLPGGFMSRSEFSLRTDGYNTSFTDEALAENSDFKDGTAYRVIPRANFDVRYPLSRNTEYGRQLIEPVVALMVAPENVGNDRAIANSDSLLFETGDTNILIADRSPGLDRVDGGTRFVTGGKLAHYFPTGNQIGLFAGQSFKITRDRELSDELGVEERASDFVGRADVKMGRYGDYYYKYNLNAEDFSLQKSELAFALGDPAFRVSGGYSFISNTVSTEDKDFERLFGSVTSQINDNWRASISTSEDLIENYSISNGLSLVYEDECFIFTASSTRTNYLTQESTNLFLLKLTYKTLGEITAF